MVSKPCAKRQKSAVLATEILVVERVGNDTLKLFAEVICEEIANVHHRRIVFLGEPTATLTYPLPASPYSPYPRERTINH